MFFLFYKTFLLSVTTCPKQQAFPSYYLAKIFDIVLLINSLAYRRVLMVNNTITLKNIVNINSTMLRICHAFFGQQNPLNILPLYLFHARLLHKIFQNIHFFGISNHIIFPLSVANFHRFQLVTCTCSTSSEIQFVKSLPDVDNFQQIPNHL